MFRQSLLSVKCHLINRNLYIGGVHMYNHARDEDAPLHQMVKALLLNSSIDGSIPSVCWHHTKLIKSANFLASVPAVIGTAFGGPLSLVGVRGRLTLAPLPLSLSTTF